MAETTAALLGGFLHALVDIFKRRGAPAAPSPAPDPAPSLPAPAGPRDIQARLIALGLLDPPADGVLGPVSRWALGEACRAAGAVFDGEATPAVRDALARARPLPLTPGSTLAGRIVRAMLARGHWIARHPDCLNIVYVEGIDPDGTPNGNAPNRFNDLRCLIRIVDGVPTLAGAWEATTEPSRRWTERPMNPRGAARIAFGQYKAWAVGRHHEHEALVQVADITVLRDANRDYRRDGDQTDSGLFGINQHWGYDLPRNDLGNSSAGCLVGRSTAGHREFMRLVKSDRRYIVSNGAYRFITTVLPASAIASSE
jgi:hypothetical protein